MWKWKHWKAVCPWSRSSLLVRGPQFDICIATSPRSSGCRWLTMRRTHWILSETKCPRTCEILKQILHHVSVVPVTSYRGIRANNPYDISGFIRARSSLFGPNLDSDGLLRHYTPMLGVVNYNLLALAVLNPRLVRNLNARYPVK